jgi:tetratricopeptide (TPR) repeat protein
MSSNDSHDRLDSWKAIASYLRRTERTARRWERHEGLPVHRLSHHDRSSVYAFKSELDAWRSTRRADPATTDVAQAALGNNRRARLTLVAMLATVVAGLGGYALWRASSPPVAAFPTLGVLPFRIDSTDAETEHLGLAVAESLVNHIAGAPDLRVRPFESSMRNYRREEEPATIGQRMGVDLIVAGQVTARDDGLAIKVALVDVAPNMQIWGTSFATTYGELGSLQKRIAHTLREEALRHDQGTAYPLPAFAMSERLSVNPEAVRHYLRGLGLWRNPGRSKLQYSIDQFRSAVGLDPDFAAAHSVLSVAYELFSNYGDLPAAEIMPLAKAHALKAIALDPHSAGGRRTLAAVSHWYDFDHEAADQQFRAAIAAAPSDAGVWNAQAEFLIDMRRFDEALAANRAASERDPGWLVADVVRGNVFLYGGRPEEAVPIYRQVLEIDPNYGISRYYLAQAYLATNRYSEAIIELELAIQDVGGAPFSMASLAYGLARVGRRAEAEEMLRDFERRRKTTYYPAYAIAMAHAGLGNNEQALEWLERAADERLMGLYLPNVDPAWDPIRREARFRRLLHRLGVTDNQGGGPTGGG